MRRSEEEQPTHPALVFGLGLIGGWMISAMMRAAAPHRYQQAMRTATPNLSRVVSGTWSTMSGDVSSLLSLKLSPVDQVHQDYLDSYASLTSSLSVVIGKMQHDADPALSTLKLSLLDQRIALSESVFNQVLAMPDVAAAVGEVSARTKTLNAEAALMPHTKDVIGQGNTVVAAAVKVVNFANGFG